MKIAICASMSFAKEMIDMAEQFKKLGHVCFIPQNAGEYADGKVLHGTPEGLNRKIENNAIRKHYELIKESDAILVLNLDKNGIKNYIGGNTLMEMGFAYILNRKIFLYNQVPEMSYADEIKAVQPIIIDGDLSKIN